MFRVFDHGAANEDISSFISGNVLESAPRTPSEWSKSSCATLLAHLRTSLLSHHPYPDKWKSIEHRINDSVGNDRALKLVTELDVKALKLCDTEAAAEEVDDTSAQLSFGKRKTQGASKQAQRKLQLRIEATEKILEELEDLVKDDTFARNAEEIESLGTRLMGQQQAILFVSRGELARSVLIVLLLKELLDYLTSPEGREICASLYCDTSRKAASGSTKKRKLSAIDTDLASAVFQDAEDDFFGLRSIKTGVLFQTVDKLGPWRVFLSGGAVQHLKQHYKSGDLHIITKKIK